MKRWYVVQIYAGYEDAIKADLVKRIELEGLADKFGDILIPSAKLHHLFATEEESKNEQLFPGYIFVEMEADTKPIRLVLSNPRVIRFLGGAQPIPLSQKEIDRILQQIKGELKVSVSEKTEYSVGSQVEIKEGPFAGFMGVIDQVDKVNERVTVMVSIFGRMTPVELGYNQVKQ